MNSLEILALVTGMLSGLALFLYGMNVMSEALTQACADGGEIVAGGERLYGTMQLRTYLEKGCVDYVQPDISHCGGITALTVSRAASL